MFTNDEQSEVIEVIDEDRDDEEDEEEDEYSDFDEEGVASEEEYDDEIEISEEIVQRRQHARIDDAECYSAYEAKLKPIIKRGTFEQFLAVYVPKKQDDEFFFGIACDCGRLDIAQHIYAHVDDLDLNGDEGVQRFDCPLSYAVANCHTRVVRWLLSLEGINVDDVYCGMDYPVLTYALLHNFPSDIVMRLADLGAHNHDNEGLDYLPLHLAVENNRVDVVYHLLIHCCNPNELDYNDQTAFDYATTPELEMIVRYSSIIFLTYCLNSLDPFLSTLAISAVDYWGDLEEAEDGSDVEDI